MKELLISTASLAIVTALGWFATWLKARMQGKIIDAVVAGVEKVGDKDVKDAIDTIARAQGAKEALDLILSRLGWLGKAAPALLLCAVLALSGCAALGQTPTATGATGVGQYGALSGLQAGSTQLSMSGSVSVQVQPGAGGALMPDAVKGLVAKIAAETDAMLADPNLPPEAKKELLARSVAMLSQLSAPWGGLTVTLSDVKTGEASVTGETGKGSGGGPATMAEPEKPEGPKAEKPATEIPAEKPAEPAPEPAPEAKPGEPPADTPAPAPAE